MNHRYAMSFISLYAVVTLTAGCVAEEARVRAADQSQITNYAAILSDLAGTGSGDGRCTDCHENTIESLKAWREPGLKTAQCLEKPSAEEKLECIMQRAPHTPSLVGEAAKQERKTGVTNLGYYTLFIGSPAFKQLWEEAKGPNEGSQLTAYQKKYMMPRLNPSQDVLTENGQKFPALDAWMKAGLPNFEEANQKRLQVLESGGSGSSCSEDSAALSQHLSKAGSQGWASINQSNGIQMFACNGQGSALSCFTQKDSSGNDLFPFPNEFGHDWSPKGPVAFSNTLRVVRKVTGRSFSYWMRSSADGRYVANGGSYIDDLQSTFDNSVRPFVTIDASYDPGFFPNNKGFTFHGSSAGGAILCDAKLLKDPQILSAGAIVTAKLKNSSDSPEKRYCKTHPVSTYQHVGAVPGSDKYYIVQGSYAADAGGGFQSGSDGSAEQFAGENTSVKVYPFSMTPGDGSASFTMGDYMTIPVASEGDWYISPTSSVLVSRIATKQGGSVVQSGYCIRKLNVAGNVAQAPSIAKAEGLRGGKPGLSFNERVIAVHHYVDKKDWKELGFASESDSAFQALLTKGSSDIYIYDLATKKRGRITNMGPGKFALFPHFRSDGWLYFLVKGSSDGTYIMASDAAIRIQQ